MTFWFWLMALRWVSFTTPGDPLSPYLFVIRMKTLSNIINRVVSGGFLSCCKVGGRGGDDVQITHLLFTDDTPVFCEANVV